jgi:hypothetical protein
MCSFPYGMAFMVNGKNSKIQRCKMQYLITSIKSNTCPSIMMKPLNLSKDG